MVQLGRQQTRETHLLLLASAEVLTIGSCVTAGETGVSSRVRHPGGKVDTMIVEQLGSEITSPFKPVSCCVRESVAMCDMAGPSFS